MRQICVFLLIILSLLGCTSTQDQPSVYLSDRSPLPTIQDQTVVPLRVSVAAVISPQGTAESYQPLIEYLSSKLNRPVELVQRRTYAETNQLLQAGKVDIAFVCTSAYIAGHDDFGMELLVAPQVKTEAVYYSVLIVPFDSPAESMADLKGKVFAFTDPISFSGRVYPTYLVAQLDSDPSDFFERTFFTYSHDNAIKAVAEGLADGAAVDSLVYDFALQNDPTLAQQVRVIHRSSAFAIPPVVTGPQIRPQLKATLQEILLGMDNDPEGQKVLQLLGFDDFVTIEDAAYQPIREILANTPPLTP
ncbi:MAG: phosphate/phosphite/phosphonate ABC transporter substrate-binding protein [Anaerolineae bacterium]|nr:phosphate/phosphite/phosphonate ABC transporter substrate-binding protein [Anaerolineae bacterium]